MSIPAEAASPTPSRPAALLAVGALASPVLGFWIPFLGLFVSLALVLLVVPWAGRSLWNLERSRVQRVAPLGWALMWLPAVLAFTGILYRAGEGSAVLGATAWLFLPLCGPEQVVPPSLVASAVFGAGAAVSAVLHRAWPWVLGALLSAVSYDLALFLFTIDFIC